MARQATIGPGIPGRTRPTELESALGPLVDDALGFADRALDASRQRQQHRGRHPDITLDVLLHRLRRGLMRLLTAPGELRAHLDVDRHLVEAAQHRDFKYIDRRALGMFQDHILYL